MTLLLTAGLVWVCAALPFGVLLGRGMRLADERAQDPFRIDGVERYLREQASAPLV
jgi:hypothetical protein